MKGLYDNHNHSQFSFDGKRTSVELSARSAAAKDLAGMCFTDHCDFHVPSMKSKYEDYVPEEFDISARNAEIDRVNAMIADGNMMDSSGMPSRLRIFKGIEIGMYRTEHKKISKLLSDNEFDEIIASIHYLDDTDPYWGGYYKGKTWKEAYGHYLETLYEELSWLTDRFDIMGHYDYVTRYAPYPECSILYRDFPDILDSILTLLAHEGKALEVNTKTYKTLKGRTPVLDKNILLRYKELGGEIIRLGSDSHDASVVGSNFDYYADYIHSCGFRYEAHFESRRLCMTKIEE